MIIGLTGAARSGKDTVADMLTKFFGDDQVARVQIAGPLKAYCREVFDWTEEHTDGAFKDVPDERYPRPCEVCRGGGKLPLSAQYNDPPYDKMCDCRPCGGTGKTYLTPRHAMQQLGGEFAEATFPPIYAVAAAKAAQKYAAAGGVAIVTDCRFVRDIEAIKDVGGIIIQMHRGESEGLIGAGSGHGSEMARTTPEFQALVDHHLYNDGTLDELNWLLRNLPLGPRRRKVRKERTLDDWTEKEMRAELRRVFALPTLDEAMARAVLLQSLAAISRAGLRDLAVRVQEAFDAFTTHVKREQRGSIEPPEA